MDISTGPFFDASTGVWSPGPTGGSGGEGIPGPAGPAGPAGPTGPAGPIGPEGPEGPMGTQGIGIRYVGTVGAEADLPATATQGDLYTVLTPEPVHGFVWDATTSAWVDAGPVQGPQGIEGPAGPAGADGKDGLPGKQGAQGVQGEVGPAGADGAVGPAGPQGDQGIQGEQGIQGIQGAAGLGITFKGNVPTEADLPATGQVQGDLWVVATPEPAHGFVWDETVPGWVDAGPVQGPQGIQGKDGAVGPAGPAGPSAVSTDAGNTSRLGTDSLIFTPATDVTGFVKNTGDKMTGPLVLPADPTNALQAATKQYVDGVNAKLFNYLPLIGGTLTGQLGLTGSATTPLRFGSESAGNFNLTMLASEGGMNWQFNSSPIILWTKDDIQARKPLVLSADPTNPLQAATKQYVDGKFAGGGYVLPAATTTVLGGVKVGTGLAVTVDGALSVSGGFLPLTGGTLTGTLTLPSGTAGLAINGTNYNMLGGSGGVAYRNGTTNIVNFAGAEISTYVPLTTPGAGVGIRFGSGGPSFSKSGTSIASSAPITVAAAPTGATELANKAYVDSVAGTGGTAYTLPPATATVLGGVKQGSGVTIAADGTLSSASAYTLPIATGTVLGGVKVGTGLTAAADGTLSVSGGASVTNPVEGSSPGMVLWVGTQAAYDAIATKNSQTLYHLLA